MEVILKKSKITTSILKQCLRSTENDFKAGEILGWCIIGQLKYIVCYRSDIKGLSKFPMFKDLVSEKRNQPQHGFDNYAVNVSIGSGYTPIVYACSTEEEKDSFIALLKKVKHNAECRGQFFT